MMDYIAAGIFLGIGVGACYLAIGITVAGMLLLLDIAMAIGEVFFSIAEKIGNWIRGR